MKKLVIALLALCCITKTSCSTKKFMEAPYKFEYTENISLIAQSSSSKYFTIPYTDRIPAQHGIPTLHEIAFKRLEPNITNAIHDLIYKRKNQRIYQFELFFKSFDDNYNDQRDEQSKFDLVEVIEAHSPHLFIFEKYINAPLYFRKATLLHEASEQNNPKGIQYLLDYGAHVNQQNMYGHAPLHYAALSNADKAIPLLIAAGADINQQDNFGLTPLHGASSNNRDKAIQLLIEAGADITIQNITGKTPRMSITDPQKLQIFDEAVAARQLKEKNSATKIQALTRGFIARKK